MDVSLRRHFGPLPHILECLRRPREGTFFSDLAADPKVFLSFHPLHLLSSGYFEKITCTYTFFDRHSRLQCVHKKKWPYLYFGSKKIAAACLVLRTRTVASFWTVARKFQDADVH